jgi:hypothetical protein
VPGITLDPFWASRHPCRPGDSGLRFAPVLADAGRPCGPLTREQGANPPRRQGYPPAFSGAPSHLPRSQSLARADGSHPRCPSLTSLPPCNSSPVPVDRQRPNRTSITQIPGSVLTEPGFIIPLHCNTPTGHEAPALVGMVRCRVRLFFGRTSFPFFSSGISPMHSIGRMERFQPFPSGRRCLPAAPTP